MLNRIYNNTTDYCQTESSTNLMAGQGASPDSGPCKSADPTFYSVAGRTENMNHNAVHADGILISVIESILYHVPPSSTSKAVNIK